MLLSFSKKMRYHSLQKVLFSIQDILEKQHQPSGCFLLSIVLDSTAVSYPTQQLVIDNHYVRSRFLTNVLVLCVIFYAQC